MKFILLQVVLLATLASVSAHASVTTGDALIQAGQLKGITGLTLTGLSAGGDHWDVEFVEGMASDVFGSLSRFPFDNEHDAFIASNALLDWITNGPYPLPNADPSLVFGIESDTSLIYTPFAVRRHVITVGVRNNATHLQNSPPDFIRVTAIAAAVDTLRHPSLVYAKWSQTPVLAPIPVPATVWLMGSGLLGLMGFSRKKNVPVQAVAT